MKRRPNVLWLMSDQHNAACTGYRGHPNVRTPTLDRIAASGVDFTHAYANNPICAPSRICFMTGEYMHTHRFFGNYNFAYPEPKHEHLGYVFRMHGYQTALIGKSHMVRRWDREGFEHIRYCDLIDSDRRDPMTNHYFRYLVEHGLADRYEEGTPKPGQAYTLDGSGPARLPYEHSIERFTGNESLAFLEERDRSRPFFLQMSFQRPHAPIAPSAEHFDMYDPDQIVLPDSAVDWFENAFAGKPAVLRDRLLRGSSYPLADKDPARLKRVLASYYALITVIDAEMGRVLDYLEASGQIENTVVFYTADHGDFAGEHGLFHKNFGLYESITKIPFLLSWPGGPQGVQDHELTESVDLFPTLCSLCDVPLPDGREGVDVSARHATGASDDVPANGLAVTTKDAAFTEWEWAGRKISAVRTKDYRLVYYRGEGEGELYDHRNDPGELHNLWSDPAHATVRHELLMRLLDFTLDYDKQSDSASDREGKHADRYTPGELVQFGRVFWSDLARAYEARRRWE
jgi:arylsulfatase A-like enzyme